MITQRVPDASVTRQVKKFGSLLLVALSLPVFAGPPDSVIQPQGELEATTTPVQIRLGINKELSYTIHRNRPTILTMELAGDVQKPVSDGFYGRASLSVRNWPKGDTVPNWTYNLNFDRDSKSNHLVATFLLDAGEYLITVGTGVNGWSNTANFTADYLSLELLLKAEDFEVPKWVPELNSWLESVGLADKVRAIAAAQGPDFRFSQNPESINAKSLVVSMLKSQRYGISGKLPIESNVQTTKQQMFIFFSTQLDRSALNLLEKDFARKQGATLWSRLFRKISLYTGSPAKDVFGSVPVACDATELYETLPQFVSRKGSFCMSASFARGIPSWLGDRLTNSATASAGGSRLRLPDFVGRYLEPRVAQMGGTIEYLYRDDSYVEAIIRNVRGWVIKGGTQWEKLQLSFSVQNDKKIRLFVDGMLASGLGSKSPPDPKFTYSMEPEYSHNLSAFSQSLLDGLVSAKE